MQNFQSTTSKHSNVERQKGDPSKLMSNSVRSNSSQIVLNQDNENAELELQLQEVTSSPAVPPSFKAAAAAAADVAATVAAMASVHPYVANFNQGYTQSSNTTAARQSQPTATLHYMPPHQQDGQLLRSHIGFSQQQSRRGLMPQQPLTGHRKTPRNAAPLQQAPRNAAPPQQAPPHDTTALTEQLQPPRNAPPSQQPPQHGATPRTEELQPPHHATAAALRRAIATGTAARCHATDGRNATAAPRCATATAPRRAIATNAAI